MADEIADPGAHRTLRGGAFYCYNAIAGPQNKIPGFEILLQGHLLIELFKQTLVEHSATTTAGLYGVLFCAFAVGLEAEALGKITCAKL
jgi:hypothetical protein